MPKQKKERTSRTSPLFFRLSYGQDIAVGPGKVTLLKLVQETGSIRQAASRMNMSYMRAWTLIRTMNRCFREPMVETIRGGSGFGGAKVTAAGLKVIQFYDQLEHEALTATKKTRRQLEAMLKKCPS